MCLSALLLRIISKHVAESPETLRGHSQTTAVLSKPTAGTLQTPLQISPSMLWVPLRHIAGTFLTSCGWPSNTLRIPTSLLREFRRSKYVQTVCGSKQLLRMLGVSAVCLQDTQNRLQFSGLRKTEPPTSLQERGCHW